MKRINQARASMLVMVGAMAIMSVISGCASQKPTGQETGGMSRVDTPLQDVKGLPEWVNNKGAAFSGERRVLHGVGSASGLRNPSLRRKAAEGQARNDMAASLQVYVASLQKQYMAETTAGDMSRQEVEQHIEETMKQVTEATLVGVQIVEIWENPLRNETYALARLDMEQFLEIMKTYKSAASGFSQLDANLRDWVRNNADKAHGQLNEELQKRKQ